MTSLSDKEWQVYALNDQIIKQSRLAPAHIKGEINMPTQNKNPEVSQAQWFDPFPEPHTIPSGWDLSEICPGPQPASVTEEDHSTESQIRNNLWKRISWSLVDK
jgi:hypothetical protein